MLYKKSLISDTNEEQSRRLLRANKIITIRQVYEAFQIIVITCLLIPHNHLTDYSSPNSSSLAEIHST